MGILHSVDGHGILHSVGSKGVLYWIDESVRLVPVHAGLEFRLFRENPAGVPRDSVANGSRESHFFRLTCVAVIQAAARGSAVPFE